MESRTYDRREFFYLGRRFFAEFYHDGSNIEVWIEEEKMCIKMKVITVPVTKPVQDMEDDLMDFLIAEDNGTVLDSYIDAFE
jgi:hypothetical protein